MASFVCVMCAFHPGMKTLITASIRPYEPLPGDRFKINGSGSAIDMEKAPRSASECAGLRVLCDY